MVLIAGGGLFATCRKIDMPLDFIYASDKMYIKVGPYTDSPFHCFCEKEHLGCVIVVILERVQLFSTTGRRSIYGPDDSFLGQLKYQQTKLNSKSNVDYCKVLNLYYYENSFKFD